jgi:hypothetical protein
VSEVAGRRFGQVVGAGTESGASTPRLDSIAVCPEKRQSSSGKNQAGGALRWPRNRKFVDSLLEGRVTSEPVSEVGFSGAKGNYGPIPRRL